ncbi:MAG: putative rane protein [Pseudomonadota bacterium]|jgi:hypothetical protein
MTSFALDLAVLLAPQQKLLAQCSTVLLWGGLIMAVPAAYFGWRDYTSTPRLENPAALQIARAHLAWNAVLVLWYALLATLRSFAPPEFGTMRGAHFVMAALGFAALFRSASLGARLVFELGIGTRKPLATAPGSDKTSEKAA